MKYEIDFDHLPDIGETARFDGRPFKVRSIEPYIRRDGGRSTLITWAGKCVDCGEPFTARTGLKSKTITKRCEAHRRQGAPATPGAVSRMAFGLRRLKMKGGSHAQRR